MSFLPISLNGNNSAVKEVNGSSSNPTPISDKYKHTNPIVSNQNSGLFQIYTPKFVTSAPMATPSSTQKKGNNSSVKQNAQHSVNLTNATLPLPPKIKPKKRQNSSSSTPIVTLAPKMTSDQTDTPLFKSIDGSSSTNIASKVKKSEDSKNKGYNFDSGINSGANASNSNGKNDSKNIVKTVGISRQPSLIKSISNQATNKTCGVPIQPNFNSASSSSSTAKIINAPSLNVLRKIAIDSRSMPVIVTLNSSDSEIQKNQQQSKLVNSKIMLKSAQSAPSATNLQANIICSNETSPIKSITNAVSPIKTTFQLQMPKTSPSPLLKQINLNSSNGMQSTVNLANVANRVNGQVFGGGQNNNKFENVDNSSSNQNFILIRSNKTNLNQSLVGSDAPERNLLVNTFQSDQMNRNLITINCNSNISNTTSSANLVNMNEEAKNI
jgi:hypothetical protein